MPPSSPVLCESGTCKVAFQNGFMDPSCCLGCSVELLLLTSLWHGRVVEWARDYWYTYFKHIREGLLEGRMPPIDFHEIISLIAPRP